MASLNIPSLKEPTPLAYKKLKAKVEVKESLQTWNRKIGETFGQKRDKSSVLWLHYFCCQNY
jgi:hypothetical protein